MRWFGSIWRTTKIQKRYRCRLLKGTLPYLHTTLGCLNVLQNMNFSTPQAFFWMGTWDLKNSWKVGDSTKKTNKGNLVGGFNPFEKYARQQHWQSSPNRGENWKKMKPPPSNEIQPQNGIFGPIFENHSADYLSFGKTWAATSKKQNLLWRPGRVARKFKKKNE